MAAKRPLQSRVGAAGWLRTNLFSNWWNTIISLLAIALSLWLLFVFAKFLLVDASWDRVWANLRLLAVFRYPADLLWRPMLVIVFLMTLFGASAGLSGEGTGAILRNTFRWLLGLVGLIALISLFAFPAVRIWWLLAIAFALGGYRLGRHFPVPVSRPLAWLWGASWIVTLLILYGVGPEESSSPFRLVPATLWGGILLTFFLSITGIVVSFPLGVALALGRQSRLPIIKGICIGFIEIIRGAPLISWLFIASLVLPLIIGANPPAIWRAQVAIILFAAAYLAENVRGGLQSVPRGQTEASRALGMSGWDTTRLIVLPQALRAVIPAIVGLFIGLFKDTSLVTIVGLSDLFAVGITVTNQPESLLITGGVTREAFIFMALFFWFFSYRMSVASRQLERQLGLGER